MAFTASPAKYVTVRAAGTCSRQSCFLKMRPCDIGWSCLSKLSGDMATKYTTNRCKSLCHLLQTDMKLYEQCSHGPSGLLLSSLHALPLIEACYLNILLSALSPCLGKILCIDIYCLKNRLHRPLNPEFPQTLISNIRLFVFPGGGTLQVSHARPDLTTRGKTGLL